MSDPMTDAERLEALARIQAKMDRDCVVFKTLDGKVMRGVLPRTMARITWETACSERDPVGANARNIVVAALRVKSWDIVYGLAAQLGDDYVIDAMVASLDVLVDETLRGKS